MTLVLVGGSYPPIPRPAASATVDAVRREWARGHDVAVVSPRPSAAHFAAPIAGPLAGRRLDNVRRLSGASRLVLCVEAGLPFAAPQRRPPGRWRSTRTARGMTRAMRRFDHVTLVIADPGLGGDRNIAVLRSAADEVIDDPRAGEMPAGITLLGPANVVWQDRLATRGGQLARAVFGERWGPLRTRLAALVRRLRRIGHW